MNPHRPALDTSPALPSDPAALVEPAPAVQRVDQDAETAWIRDEHGPREVRLHDYQSLYAVPGLYETLFGTVLVSQCSDPLRDTATALAGFVL